MNERRKITCFKSSFFNRNLMPDIMQRFDVNVYSFQGFRQIPCTMHLTITNIPLPATNSNKVFAQINTSDCNKNQRGGARIWLSDDCNFRWCSVLIASGLLFFAIAPAARSSAWLPEGPRRSILLVYFSEFKYFQSQKVIRNIVPPWY